ncbi:ABC exporter membrane fusion protein [Mastigocoleus testarum]|uniref:ABC transporter permease n=1 Tax=Mastigocoleus testarum BC008 TaxID=371196 RepID=A0A0V7ZIW8_9CYAN|nr:ABC exporter membrane fusion protein [Mastigocoleus testarum]KST64440.1 ABC transporter permease [Mastigocoleus testarum BC008]
MTADKESRLSPQPTNRWRIILATLITLGAGLAFSSIFWRLSSQVNSPPIDSGKTTPKRVAVTALGRVEPEGEVIKLSAPSSLTGVRVEKLLVKEGDKVKAGKIIALLENYARSRAALQQTIDKVRIARAKLAQVKAGAKQGDINAQRATVTRLQAQLQGDIASQQATIARLEAELANARTENNRYQSLYRAGAVSASVADSKRLELQTAQKQLQEAQAKLKRTQNTVRDEIEEARARLDSVKKVRAVDVQLAQAELKSAQTAVQEAKAEYDLTYLSSPVDGRILKVHAKTGEVNSDKGVVEIGKTSQMYVEAEVYQTDINQVNKGQQAIITSAAFPKKIEGTVTEIGLQVDRQNILSVNPETETDRRIIPVKVRINDPKDSETLSGLTNLQVDVAIMMSQKPVISNK